MREASAVISELQRMLDAVATEKTKQWFEGYLRGVIPFRGARLPEVRKTVAAWRAQAGLASLPEERQLEIALALFEEPFAEDKLAGILYLQAHLQDRLPWRSLFAAYATLYERMLIFDWSTCDWFCMRVLGPTLAREGKPCAEVLREWSQADYLWQARSGVVPFVKVAREAAYRTDIEAVCSAVIRREERFSKTAVGWVLREVSRHDAAFVQRFVEEHSVQFSVESVRNATKYFERPTRDRLVALVKQSR